MDIRKVVVYGRWEYDLSSKVIKLDYYTMENEAVSDENIHSFKLPKNFKFKIFTFKK